jgi:plasmid stabilization system protein ParE
MSPEAEADLVKIGDYIARRRGSPKTALNTIRKIKARIDELEDFPLIGKPLSAVVSTDTDYRFLGCGSYLAFYRYENDSVFIDRILHGRQDYVSILLGNIDESED